MLSLICSIAGQQPWGKEDILLYTYLPSARSAILGEWSFLFFLRLCLGNWKGRAGPRWHIYLIQPVLSDSVLVSELVTCQPPSLSVYLMHVLEIFLFFWWEACFYLFLYLFRPIQIRAFHKAFMIVIREF